MIDSNQWKLAMQLEMHAMHKNQSWNMIKLPKVKKDLPYKWVYMYKLSPHHGQPK